MLLERRRAPLWLSLVGRSGGSRPSPQAQTVLDCLATHGALFLDPLVEHCRMLRTQVEEALAELVALGLVNSDSFGGLRALLVPSAQRRPIGAARRRGRVLSFGMESAGRWSHIPRNNHADTTAAVEHVARTLLRRYGIVFWAPPYSLAAAMARSAARLPPARGTREIRDGRFVAGFSGEQYALPEAVGYRTRTPVPAWGTTCRG
jgi:ATP-dependent Lhr-like helicase